MLLKRFNVYASHVEFDPHGGGVNEVSAILPGATVSGQADSLGEISLRCMPVMASFS